MAVIPLTKGRVALVDDEDLARVVAAGKPHWRFSKGGFAVTGTANGYAVTGQSARGDLIAMHRLVLGLDPSESSVDHVNGDGLDNRKANLRLATRTENSQNMRKPRSFGKKPGTSSKFKGVSYVSPGPRSSGRWQAHITVRKQQRYLGTFAHEEDAARAYDVAAVEEFGSFAWTNEKEGLL